LTHRPIRGVSLVLAGATCYAVLPALVKVSYEHGADSRGLLALRFAIAAPILLAVGARHRPRASWAALPAVAVPSALYFFQTLTFFESLAQMSAVAAVPILFSYPLLVAIGGAVVLGNPLPRRSVALIVLGSIGVYLSVGFTGSVTTLGVVLAIASAVLFALFFLSAKRLLTSEVLDGLTFTTLTFTVTGVAFAALWIVSGGSSPTDGVGWAAVLAIAGVGTAVAAVLLYSGLPHLDAGTAAMLSAAEPPLAVVLAAVLLKESVGPVQVTGILIVVVALAGLSYLATRQGAVVEAERSATLAG
jgi:drug/metabolite transporter (DMT)-like permease